MKHIFSLLLMAVVGVALIITGTKISSSNQYPHETINSNPTWTTMPSQETSSATTSLTTIITETQTTTEDSQESSPSTVPTTSETTPSSKESTVTKPKTTTKPRTKPPKTTPKLKGAAAITFDDGPGGHTSRLLNALKQYNAKATFFVIGSGIANPENQKYKRSLIKRMVDEGHEVANHSYDHKDFTKLSDKDVLSQIRKNERCHFLHHRRKTDTFAASVRLIQPPHHESGGTRGACSSCFGRRVRKTGNIEDVDYVYNYIIDHVTAGSTLLLHDIHKTTVDAFIKALPVLTERCLKLVTVSELVDLKPGDVHPSWWWR